MPSKVTQTVMYNLLYDGGLFILFQQCFTDLPIGTLMSSSGNYVKASCKFVACNVELGGKQIKPLM